MNSSINNINMGLTVSLNLIYNALYTELGFVNSSKDNKVGLWDVFVPLKSELTVQLQIENGDLSNVSIYLSSILLGQYNGVAVENIRDNINKEFFFILYDKIKKFLESQVDLEGIKLIRQPLVCSPIWSDGTKDNFGRLKIASAINLFDKVVLLGPPGSGKSTTAKVIVCTHLLRHLTESEIDKLGLWGTKKLHPIFIEIKSLVNSTYFPPVDNVVTIDVVLNFLKIEILKNDAELYSYYLKSLTQGGGLFVFDGLDEITVPESVVNVLDKRREQLQSLMESISRQFPLCKILITSRPAGYSGWELKNFDTINISPIDEQESLEIISSLYTREGLSLLKIQEYSNILIQHLKKIPESIQHQPLFVVLLAKLYLENTKAELPVKRGALINHSIQLLLSSWYTKVQGNESLLSLLGCSEVELIDKLEIIGKRSLELETSSPNNISNDIPRALILDELAELKFSNIQKVLSYISDNAGVLSSPAPKIYKFAHRLFQEYLAASFFSKDKNYKKNLLASLEKSFQTWQEVALLLCDILVSQNRELDVWNFIALLAESKKKNFIWLAAKIIKDQHLDINDQALIKFIGNNIKKELITLAGDSEFALHQKIDIIRSLDYLEDTRSGVNLDEDGIPDIFWCPIPETDAIIGTSSTQIDILQLYGAEKWQFSRETPSFEARIASFYISRYPITVKQFQSFVKATDGYYNDKWWSVESLSWRKNNAPPIPLAIGNNCPQNYVTWYESVAFCRWLGHKLNAEIRLPTEMEWEVAAKRLKDNLYPWGNEKLHDKANSREMNIEDIIPVGCLDDRENFPQEMLGNTWEWCSSIVENIDGYIYSYPYNNDDGRENMEGGDNVMRATRGGYYMADLLTTRCAYRGRDIPSSRLKRQGFRVVKGAN